MVDIEREAIRAEGLDPDDPAVVDALKLVRLELALHTMRRWGRDLIDKSRTALPDPQLHGGFGQRQLELFVFHLQPPLLGRALFCQPGR
ncbi:hypothetical protein [Mycobacterium sp. HNNTM2301]|uniref:hypothetical protein n=1 Tax=Mycobacterium hainanense TaxID=3289775 RepID=UPI0035A675F2